MHIFGRLVLCIKRGNQRILIFGIKVIPAEYNINKILDKKGYCGFLRLLALLGGEIEDK